MAKLRKEFILLIVVLAAVIGFNEGIKVVAGTPVPLAIVEGNSMIPTFHDGDIILVVGVKPSDLKVDDIIIYETTTKLVVHRIIEIKVHEGKYYFKTQGDNNPTPDPWLVPEDKVLGKVVGVIIPRIGVVLKFLMPYRYVIVAALVVLAVVVAFWPSKKEEESERSRSKKKKVKFKKGFK
ncbi:MAG: signal peptidase I [Thermoprotei archaeon]|nr:MAG: signal peptidase I [Thermoprotei archaeon]RLF21135.1 MAG: signal peptidase I [Thermoprotei archaeon]